MVQWTVSFGVLAFQYQIKKYIKKNGQKQLQIKNTHMLTAQTKQKRQEPHKRAYLSKNGGLWENKKIRKMGQKQKRIRQKERPDLAEDQERRYTHA